MALLIPADSKDEGKKKNSFSIPAKGRFGLSLIFGKKEFFLGVLIDDVLTAETRSKRKRLSVGSGKAVDI